MKTKRIIDFKLSVYHGDLKSGWRDPVILRGIFPTSLVSENSGDSNYPLLLSTGEKYSINGKPKIKGEEKLRILHNIKGPWEDGRLVFGDHTFSVRLLNFVSKTSVSDASGEEEREYLLGVAKRLLMWQNETVAEEWEKEYLSRVGAENGG